MATMIQEPDKFDVLCGKDKTCVNWPGSKRFRIVIESYRQKYSQAFSKYDKMMITKEIYDSMNETTSRFLKFNESTQVWEELSVMAARDKIGHSLRFANRKKRRGGSSSGSGDEVTEVSQTSIIPSAGASASARDIMHVPEGPLMMMPPSVVAAAASSNANEEEEEEVYRPFTRFPSRTEYTHPLDFKNKKFNAFGGSSLHQALTMEKAAVASVQQQQPSQQEQALITGRHGSRKQPQHAHGRKHTVSIGGELWTIMQEQISDWDDQHTQKPAVFEKRTSSKPITTHEEIVAAALAAAQPSGITTRTSRDRHNRKHTVSIGGELWTVMQEQISDWGDFPIMGANKATV